MRVESAWNPDDLFINETIAAVFQSDALTPTGAQAFVSELLRAWVEAKRTRSLNEVNHVITRWHRTLLLVEEKGVMENYDRAKNSSSGRSYTVGEARARLGVE